MHAGQLKASLPCAISPICSGWKRSLTSLSHVHPMHAIIAPPQHLAPSVVQTPHPLGWLMIQPVQLKAGGGGIEIEPLRAAAAAARPDVFPSHCGGGTGTAKSPKRWQMMASLAAPQAAPSKEQRGQSPTAPRPCAT